MSDEKINSEKLIDMIATKTVDAKTLLVVARWLKYSQSYTTSTEAGSRLGNLVEVGLRLAEDKGEPCSQHRDYT